MRVVLDTNVLVSAALKQKSTPGMAVLFVERQIAHAWAAGLNWYLTPNFKYVVNVERTVFDDGAVGARRPENAVVLRTQLNF